MRVRGATTITRALLDWSYHEASGRFATQLQAVQDRIRKRDPEADLLALDVLLRFRAPLIAQILLAEPVRVALVDLDPGDLPRMAVLEHDLAAFSAQGSPDPEGEKHIQALELLAEVPSPFLAVAQGESGPYCILDGVHRAMAWARHVRANRTYPIAVNVIVTGRPTWWEQTQFPEARTHS